VIEVLEENNFEITSIAGTSMGSLIGGVYALGKLEEYKDWISDMDKIDVLSMVDFTLSRQGLVKGDKVLNKMQELIPDSNIEDLPIPYAAVAVDIMEGREIIFRKGSLYDAVRASISIPTVFTPVESGDGLLVDGGILNNIPVDRVERVRRDMLVAVNVNANVEPVTPAIFMSENDKKEKTYQKRIKEFQLHLRKVLPKSDDDKLGYFNLINRTIGTMTNYMALKHLETHKPDLLINISKKSCGMFEFYKAEELVEIGRMATLNALKDLK
jgi:NTE family protein